MMATHTRPRLLVLATQAPWPLDHGNRLRLHHLLRCLVERLDITLAIPQAQPDGAMLPDGLTVEVMSASACSPPNRRRSTYVAALARRYFGHNARVDAWVQRHATPRRFDVALCSGPVLGQHLHAFRVPVVWDLVDDLVLFAARECEHQPWSRRWSTLYAAGLNALFERDAARHAATTVVASDVDASYARRWIGAEKLTVVSNGVDLEHFADAGEPPPSRQLAFVGSLEFPPNVDGIVHFARTVWPRLHANDPTRELRVVGCRPTPEVAALAQRPGVSVHANVADVRPFLRAAQAIIVPTRTGGGVKNKVLEACAMRRPVVATPRALGGLSARAGRDVLCANSPRRWVEHVSRLLTQPEWGARIARNGHTWVRQAHRWNVMAERLLAVLRRAARTWPNPAPGSPGASENLDIDRGSGISCCASGVKDLRIRNQWPTRLIESVKT